MRSIMGGLMFVVLLVVLLRVAKAIEAQTALMKKLMEPPDS